jgi:hypothetical protein
MARQAVRAGLALAVALVPGLAPRAARADGWTAALGLAATWQERRDFGENTRANFVPELLGFGYRPIAGDRLFLRAGARLAYSGLTQAEMPYALQVQERDLVATGELGLALDGAVVPSLTVGAGFASRWISLDARQPVDDGGEHISRHQVLATGYVQVGLGIPLARGFLLAEPILRHERTAGDDRAAWRYGLELTVQLF